MHVTHGEHCGLMTLLISPLPVIAAHAKNIGKEWLNSLSLYSAMASVKRLDSRQAMEGGDYIMRKEARRSG